MNTPATVTAPGAAAVEPGTGPTRRPVPLIGDPVDAVLLERVLQPYRGKGCVYLTSASTGPVDGGVRVQGELAIPGSCYIDDTGHLNAAEVIICYNQLLYTLLAVSIRDRCVPALSGWTLEQYWVRQLDGVLITRQSTTFTRPLDARGFRGEVVFGQALTGRAAPGTAPSVTVGSRFRFGDADGDACHGEVRVVVVP